MEIVPLMELDECFLCIMLPFRFSYVCSKPMLCFTYYYICCHLNGKQFFKGGQALSMISKENVVENSNCYGEPKWPE